MYCIYLPIFRVVNGTDTRASFSAEAFSIRYETDLSYITLQRSQLSTGCILTLSETFSMHVSGKVWLLFWLVLMATFAEWYKNIL